VASGFIAGSAPVIDTPQTRQRHRAAATVTESKQLWANTNRDWDLNRDLSTFAYLISTAKVRFKRSRFDLKSDLNFFCDSI